MAFPWIPKIRILRASPPLGRKAGSRNALRRAQSMHWIFLGWHSPTVTCILALQPGLFSKNCHEYYLVPKSGTIHKIASGWGPGMWAQQEQRSPTRIVSGARSLKSHGCQGRGIGEGWGIFLSEAASKGLPRPFNSAGWKCSKGPFTHKTESPWPHRSQHPHWWKRWSRSKFATSHYTWGTNQLERINQLKIMSLRNLLIILEEFRERTQIHKEKPKDVNM